MKCPHCGGEVEPVLIASGEDFEKYLCDQINTLSCATCEMTKATGDQGVDLIVTLKGGARIAVQCKLYSTPVGNDAVQEVIAGRIFYKCEKAVVVTNSTYTQGAIELAKSADVDLLGHKEFKEYINQMSGGFEKDVYAELDAFLSQGNREAEMGKELRFAIGLLLSKFDNVFSLPSVIDEVIKEGDLHRRKLANVTKWGVYTVLGSLFMYMPRRADEGGFGEELRGLSKLRMDAHKVLELTEDRKKGVAQYQEIWQTSFEYLDSIDKHLKMTDGFSESIESCQQLPGMVANLMHGIEAKEVASAQNACYQFKNDARRYMGTLFGHQVPWGVDIYK